jgi:hypothetical protein
VRLALNPKDYPRKSKQGAPRGMTATGPKAESNKEEATFVVPTELVSGRVHYELDRSARRSIRHRIKSEHGDKNRV